MNKFDLLCYVLERYCGISLRGRREQQIRCPFHDDRRPSARIYVDTGKFYCFRCNLSLDAVGFLARFFNMPVTNAISLLEQDLDAPTNGIGFKRRVPFELVNELREKVKTADNPLAIIKEFLDKYKVENTNE